ncbi:MAG: RNA 2',3'-cyclic phosphodiesterase [Candidatus Eremiobacteraeota bacterium]|nr:RNA 2',3'-cyclic phosphodiesterase [Candidatus Eremiobacteraeota bacterium]
MSYRPKLFVGVELDDNVRAACSSLAERLNARGLIARYERPEKLHITLAFLGWVDPEMVEPIAGAMNRVAAEHKPFALRLDRVGAFPQERRPRVVWVGSQEQGQAFRDVSRALQNAYRDLGFSFDKDAVAHVTIARVKEPRSPLPMLDSIEPVNQRVKSLTLFDSIPDKGTTRYEVVNRAPLR